METVKSESSLWSYLNNEKFILVLSLTSVLVVSVHVLSTFFWGDDFLHFYQISNWNPLEFIFLPFGNQFFPFRQLIYYCLFKLFGVNPVIYFSIALLTHIVCAYILYKIILLFTDKPSLAAAGSMIWGIHPGNIASLAYFPAYGQALTGLLFLLFLFDLLKIERGDFSFSKKTAIRWSIYALLMATSYGTGLAIACLFPIIIVIILWKSDNKWKIVVSMLPLIAVILVLFIFKDSIYYYFSGKVSRTAPLPLDVAFSNYKLILEMFIRMCAFGIYTMAAFPIFILTYKPSLSPQYPVIAFFISIPVVILFLTAFFRSRNNKQNYFVLGIIFIGLIGLHAYGRAVLLQFFSISVSLASMTFRYYYVVFIPIVLILSLMVNELLNLFPKISKVVIAFVFTTIVISIYPSMNLAKAIDPSLNLASKERKIYYETIAEIDKTIRTYPAGSSVFIDNAMKNPITMLYPSSTDFPGKAAVFSIGYPHNTVEGRRVYFVENDCSVAQQNIAEKNWRISSLIVSGCNFKK